MDKFAVDKLKLRRIEADANPPMMKPKERSIKEKLYFWWADVKFFFSEKFLPTFVDCMLLVFAYLILLQITIRIVRSQP